MAASSSSSLSTSPNFCTTNSNDNTNFLLPSLQRVDPKIVSYETKKHIVQGSAEGFIVEAKVVDDDNNGKDDERMTSTTSTRNLFIKYVDVQKYSHKPWADLRRTCHYLRTEVRFYNEILPLLRDTFRQNSEKSSTDAGNNNNIVIDDWNISPKVYVAEYNLEGLMDENESTSATAATTTEVTNTDPQYDKNDQSVLEGKFGIIIMDDVNKVHGCFQKSPLERNIAISSVIGLAKFHATAFQNEKILHTLSERLCAYGGSYHLRNRNPKELQNMVTAWERFMKDMDGVPGVPNGFFDEPSKRALGQRLVDSAEYISKELSPKPASPYATIVHGDYKAMNVFFCEKGKGGNNNNNDEVEYSSILIDFASTGVGLGMSDLAMHVAHAILPYDLDSGIEEVLMEKYYDALQHALPENTKGLYSKEQALRHYGFATIDYFRFILGKQWNGATIQTFEKRNEDTNFAMVNRSVEAAIKFIERTDKYLKMIEEERKTL